MKQPHHCQVKAYRDYYLHQAGRGYPVYVGTRFQRGHGSIFGNLFKSVVPLLKRGANTLGREAFKAASDVMEGQNVTQAAKSRLKSTGQTLLQKAIIEVGPPGERSIKRAAKRQAQTSLDEATEHIERHLRLQMALVHPNSCECTKSELDLLGVPPTQTSVEQWLLGAKRIDIGTDGSRSLRICSQWSWRGLHRSCQCLLVCGSTDREYRWF